MNAESDPPEPLRILVVDDSAVVVKKLESIVKTAGWTILDVAHDGIEGVEKYKQHHPNIDVVTMDITMPRMNGIQCLEEILRFDPRARVVMVSSLGDTEMIKEAIAKGARYFLVKPFERVKTMKVLAEVAAGR